MGQAEYTQSVAAMIVPTHLFIAQGEEVGRGRDLSSGKVRSVKRHGSSEALSAGSNGGHLSSSQRGRADIYSCAEMECFEAERRGLGKKKQSLEATEAGWSITFQFQCHLIQFVCFLYFMALSPYLSPLLNHSARLIPLVSIYVDLIRVDGRDFLCLLVLLSKRMWIPHPCGACRAVSVRCKGSKKLRSSFEKICKACLKAKPEPVLCEMERSLKVEVVETSNVARLEQTSVVQEVVLVKKVNEKTEKEVFEGVSE
jgi:hypothetical protein